MKVLKPVVALSAVALSTAVWAKTPRFPTLGQCARFTCRVERHGRQLHQNDQRDGS